MKQGKTIRFLSICAVVCGVINLQPAYAQSAAELFQRAEGMRISAESDGELREALELYSQAAELGRLSSYYRIGVIQLELGNQQAALEALDAAANHGSNAAVVLSAEMHATGGFGELSEQSKGLSVLQELAEQPTGLRAARALVNIYENDLVSAAGVYRLLAERGDARALRTLGRLYARGSEGHEIPKDLDIAIDLLSRAVNAGSNAALRDLGLAQIEAEDFAGAKASLERGAQLQVNGSAANLANAHFRSLLGSLSEPSKGRADLRRLAEEGDIYAARHALRHYERRSRRITELDLDRVLDHLWDATEQDNSLAATTLARYYRKLSWMMTDEREQIARLVNDYPDALGETGLAEETVSMLYDRNNHLASQAAVFEYLDTLNGPGYAAALLRLRSIEVQGFIKVVQGDLRELGYYSGLISGVATPQTVRSMLRYCGDQGFYDACVHGPVLYQSSKLIAEALEEERG